MPKFEEKQDYPPTLEEMQKFVGGYIEVVRLPTGDQMVINEEGKLKGLEMNPLATLVFQLHYGPHDIIVGDVLVLKGQARLN